MASSRDRRGVLRLPPDGVRSLLRGTGCLYYYRESLSSLAIHDLRQATELATVVECVSSWNKVE